MIGKNVEIENSFHIHSFKKKKIYYENFSLSLKKKRIIKKTSFRDENWAGFFKLVSRSALP